MASMMFRPTTRSSICGVRSMTMYTPFSPRRFSESSGIDEVSSTLRRRLVGAVALHLLVGRDQNVRPLHRLPHRPPVPRQPRRPVGGNGVGRAAPAQPRGQRGVALERVEGVQHGRHAVEGDRIREAKVPGDSDSVEAAR